MILSLLTQRAANNIVLYYEGIKAKIGWCPSPFTSLYLYRSNSKGFQIEIKKDGSANLEPITFYPENSISADVLRLLTFLSVRLPAEQVKTC